MTSNNQRRRKPRRRSSFPPPSFPRPTRHSCGGRNPSSLPAPPVIPAEAGNPCGCPFPAPTRFHPSYVAFARPWSFLRRQESILFPLRAPPVIPAPHPSFLRRQESIPFPLRAPSVIPAVIPAGIHPLPSAPHPSSPGPHPSFLRRQESRIPGPTRHSCGGRNPSPPRPPR